MGIGASYIVDLVGADDKINGSLALSVTQADADAKALDQARERRLLETSRFTQARQDRQVIERFKEKKLETWQTESARSEQQVQDEIARRQGAGKDQV